MGELGNQFTTRTVATLRLQLITLDSPSAANLAASAAWYAHHFYRICQTAISSKLVMGYAGNKS